jgi:hypothetical protein
MGRHEMGQSLTKIWKKSIEETKSGALGATLGVCVPLRQCVTKPPLYAAVPPRATVEFVGSCRTWLAKVMETCQGPSVALFGPDVELE